MPENVMEFRVCKLYSGDRETPADTEWMDAVDFVKLLRNDIVTTNHIELAMLDQDVIQLSPSYSVRIERRVRLIKGVAGHPIASPNCVICGKLVHNVPLPLTDNNVQGDIRLRFGYGSRHDLDVFYGCICDDCGEKIMTGNLIC
jgi:hypothetical protein